MFLSRLMIGLMVLATMASAQMDGAETSASWDGIAFRQNTPDAMEAWFVLPTKVVLDDASLSSMPTPATFKLRAGRGEYECAQLVVRPPAEVKGVSVVVSDLVGEGGRIPASAWQAQKLGTMDARSGVGPKTMRRKGLLPDPILPDPIFDLAGGKYNAIWLTVFVPKDAAPGLYEGQVRVVQAEKAILEVPISLEVWNFTIPDETHLIIMANVWPTETWFRRYTNAPLWDCLRPYYDNLKAHRINATASIYPLGDVRAGKQWTREGPPEGLAEYEKALRYVLDDLGFVRFRFPGVGGAVGGLWNRIKVFRDVQLPEGIWIGGGDFVRAHPSKEDGAVWAHIGGAVLRKRPRGMKEGWVEYEFDAKRSGSLWMWLQVDPSQDQEKKIVSLDGASLGTLTGADFRKHPLGFARLPNKIELAAGKHTLRVELTDLWGVSDPLCAVFLTAEETPDFDRLLRDTAVLTDEFKEAYRYHVEQAAAFFQERGWLDKAQMKLKDEPNRGEYGRVAAAYEFARELLPKAKRELSEEPCPILWQGVNVWTPYYTRFDPQACAERQKAGDEVWLYCNALHGIGYPTISMRLVPWILWRYGMDGYLFWSVNCWTDDPWEKGCSPENIGMNGIFLYPNPKDGLPLNSVRWEMFREGLEDYETLLLLRNKVNELKKAGAPSEKMKSLLHEAEEILAQKVTRLVPSATEPNLNPIEFERIRTAIGDTLSALNSSIP